MSARSYSENCKFLQLRSSQLQLQPQGPAALLQLLSVKLRELPQRLKQQRSKQPGNRQLKRQSLSRQPQKQRWPQLKQQKHKSV
jgi:hypothetical protein